MIVEYTLPKPEQVVEHAEIYTKQSLQFDESQFSIEEIKQNVLSTDYVTQMNQVVNEVYNDNSRSPNFSKIIPSIDIKPKSFLPNIEIEIAIKWSSDNIKERTQIKDTNGIPSISKPDTQSRKGKFEVIATIGYKISADTFVSKNYGVTNTSTIKTTTTFFELTVGAGYELDVLGAIQNKIKQAKYENGKQEENIFLKDAKKLSDEQLLAEMIATGLLSADDNYQANYLSRQEQEQLVADMWGGKTLKQVKNESVVDHIQKNQEKADKTDGGLFKFEKQATIAPFVSVQLGIEAFFDIALNAEIGTKLVWKTKVEDGTIKSKGEEIKNYHNETKTFTGNINISGRVESKVGIRANAYVTL